MTKTTFGVLLMVFTLWAWSPASAEDPKTGEDIFKAKKCTMCHKYQAPVADQEIAEGSPPNLHLVGDRHDAEWMTQYLKKEIDKDGAKHKVAWKGPAEDLEVLTNWLASLKSPAEPAGDVEETPVTE